ncbi:hypothetical protein BH23PSE2_BH23PSE2_03070 [soil metagenome]
MLCYQTLIRAQGSDGRELPIRSFVSVLRDQFHVPGA